MNAPFFTSRHVAICMVVLLATASVTAVLAYPQRLLVLSGANDFLSFYAGGRLAFTSDLYRPERAQEVQQQLGDAVTDRLPFIRLPYIAAVLWPLARLPYTAAYSLWQTVNLLSILALVGLWSVVDRRWLALALAGSVALQWNFANGQNLPMVLLFFVAALRELNTGRDLRAGLLLALCLDKFHLFLLVPLVLLSRGMKKAALGFALGISLILAVSFAAAGPRWPVEYAQLLVKSTIHDRQAAAPNLFGIVSLIGGGYAVLAILAALTGAAVVVISRRDDPTIALAAAVLGSLLVTPHIFIQDLALVLPVAVLAIRRYDSPVVRVPAFLLLTPFPYWLELTAPFPAGQIIPLAMSALLAAACTETLRKDRSQNYRAAKCAPAPTAPRI